MSKLIWHYTTAVHMATILKTQVLRTSPRNPGSGEVPGVWFSLNPLWEPTATKRVGTRDRRTGEVGNWHLATMDELSELMGICRIGVEEGPQHLTFPQYSVVANRKYVAHLMAAAFAMGKEIGWSLPHGPVDWRVCLREVGMLEFKEVQSWREGKWHGG